MKRTFFSFFSHYVLVEFRKKIDLNEAEEIKITAEGTFNIKLDGGQNAL